MNIMGRGNDGAPDRVLNAPTNEAWIDPWVTCCASWACASTWARRSRRSTSARPGRVRARVDRRGRPHDRGRLVRLRDAGRARAQALVERGPRRRPVARADGRALRRLDERHPVLPGEKVDIVRGHVTFVDAPWALTALTRRSSGPSATSRATTATARPSTASRSTSPTGTRPGSSTASPAKLCTRDEIADEVWAQIKAHLEDNGEDVLPDDIVDSWFLDPAIRVDPKRGRNRNDEPLLVNTVGSWEKRPTARHRDPQPLPRRRLRADRHRPRDDGGRERVGPRGGQRAARGGRVEGRAAAMYRLYDPPSPSSDRAT